MQIKETEIQQVVILWTILVWNSLINSTSATLTDVVGFEQYEIPVPLLTAVCGWNAPPKFTSLSQ